MAPGYAFTAATIVVAEVRTTIEENDCGSIVLLFLVLLLLCVCMLVVLVFFYMKMKHLSSIFFFANGWGLE